MSNHSEGRSCGMYQQRRRIIGPQSHAQDAELQDPCSDGAAQLSTETRPSSRGYQGRGQSHPSGCTGCVSKIVHQPCKVSRAADCRWYSAASRGKCQAGHVDGKGNRRDGFPSCEKPGRYRAFRYKSLVTMAGQFPRESR